MSYLERGAAWFLAQLKPNSHRIAENHLARQGFRTFLPQQEETRRAGRKFVTQLHPLFPGYIFVAIDLRQGGWRAVKSTRGITRLVGFGNMPTPVPLDLVSQLMIRCDGEGRLLPKSAFKVGDMVKLTKGPFSDFVARIEHIERERRIHVLMDLMGAQTRVVVDAVHARAL